MRLKSIKLAGFKSFVDPTRIDFPNNLTAVVGPNGCGKSNVIDAVRWVMGESSAKHLRGQAMTDVIFNGSSKRQPVGQCSVELMFDNADRTLTGPYAEYNEIAVRRKVTRDGQSTYFLNGSKCRRRDITDLFSGTGLGPRSYAIIEQGMISRLIEARPEELRVYIEEAAGISRYKDRRRETENRMRRTEENLGRLHDIQSELERQLAHLQRQAQTAEKYQALKADERQYRARLMALRWRDLDRERRASADSFAEAQRDEENARARLRSAEADQEALRESENQAQEAFQDAQKTYYEAGTRIARLEQQAARHKDRQTQLQAELARLTQEQHSLRDDAAADREALTSAEERLEQLREELAMADEQVAEADLQLQDAQADYEAADEAWLATSSDSAEIGQKLARWRATLEQSSARLQQLQVRRERLQQSLDEQSSTPASAETRQLQEELAATREQLETVQGDSEALDERIQALREEQEARQAELSGKRQQLHDDQQELIRIKARLDAHGGDDETLSDWLTRWQWHREPRVAEQLDAASPWQAAVEWVLGHWLQARVLPAEALPDGAWSNLPEGRMGWILGRSGTTETAKPGTLASVVNAPAVLLPWLNQVRLADDLSSARAAVSSLGPQDSVICPEGVWLGPGWARVFRSPEDSQGILVQREELEQREARVEDIEFELEDLSLNLQAARQSLEQLEADGRNQRAQVDDYRARVHELERKLSGREAANAEAGKALERTREDLDDAVQDYENTLETYQEAAEAVSELEQARDAQLDQTAARSARDEARVKLEDARGRHQSGQQRQQELALEVRGLSTQMDALADTVRRNTERAAQLSTRQDELKDELGTIEAPDTSVHEELEAALQDQLEWEEKLQAARSRAEELQAQWQATERERVAAEQAMQQEQERVQSLTMALERVQTRQQGLEEQLREQNYDLNAVLQTLDDDTTVADCEQQIEEVTDRIRRLGPINLAAIDEYQVQAERQAYLARQQEDLERALSTLDQAIRRIDQETRSRFKATFDRVNAGLQELFPRVFGGGHAYLDLTGEDLLSTGVAIMARPPGKKNATIHLLSGGEKALTAIALVFSIFRLNPAPFCMLDEVDAPLDDANVTRFSRLVESMAGQVEFIYITHNKVAMEIAQQLMGVTMSEPGVSRLVSVNVDEAVAMATA